MPMTEQEIIDNLFSITENAEDYLNALKIIYEENKQALKSYKDKTSKHYLKYKKENEMIKNWRSE